MDTVALPDGERVPALGMGSWGMGSWGTGWRRMRTSFVGIRPKRPVGGIGQRRSGDHEQDQRQVGQNRLPTDTDGPRDHAASCSRRSRGATAANCEAIQSTRS